MFGMILDSINNFLYTYILVFLLSAMGIFFSIKTKFIQIRLFPDAIRAMKTEPAGKKEITPFHALMISTASRVGIGNIAGVSTAIVLGGAGSVFWMWLLAVLGGASSFIETTLGQMYKVKGPEPGIFHGGPSYYIRQGLGRKRLGVLFAVLLMLTYGYGANTLQAYNIMDAFHYYTKNPWMPVITGAVLAVLTAVAAAGGSYLISRISTAIVPVMAAIYLLMTLVVIGANLSAVPAMLKSIFQQAFDFHAFSGGLTGSCVLYGVKGPSFQRSGYGQRSKRHILRERLSPGRAGSGVGCFRIHRYAADLHRYGLYSAALRGRGKRYCRGPVCPAGDGHTIRSMGDPHFNGIHFPVCVYLHHWELFLRRKRSAVYYEPSGGADGFSLFRYPDGLFRRANGFHHRLGIGGCLYGLYGHSEPGSHLFAAQAGAPLYGGLYPPEGKRDAPSIPGLGHRDIRSGMLAIIDKPTLD